MDISRAIAQAVPDLLKPRQLYQIQLSEDLWLIEKTLKPHWKSQNITFL